MVITVTLDAALEKTLRVPGLRLGVDCRAERAEMRPGGRALRTAMAVRELGGRVAAVGVAGGAEGEYIRDQLDQMGLPNDLTAGRARTPVELRLMDGERVTRIRETPAKASERELREVWRKVSDLAGPGDVAVFAGELPASLTPEMLGGWIDRLRRDGVLTVLDVEEGRKYAAAAPDVLIEEEDNQVLFSSADETLRRERPEEDGDEMVTAHFALELAVSEDWRKAADVSTRSAERRKSF